MKLALLPGLGATSAIFGPEYDDLADDVLRCDWPEHAGERTVAEFAERWLDAYPLADQDVIAGSSFGGMVGAEIARRTSPRALVLIGSARHPREVNMLLRQLAKMGDRLPVEHLQNLLGLDFVADRSPILRMLAEADPDQVRGMTRAIFAWEGCVDTGCSSLRVHGAWDLVIPPPQEGAEIVARGGHMIPMTHAEVVAGFLRRVIEGL